MMNVKKFKKFVLLLMTLSLATMLTVVNVHATKKADNETGGEQKIPELVQDVVKDESTTKDEVLPKADEIVSQKGSENATDTKDVATESQYDHLLKDLILKDVDWTQFDSDSNSDHISVTTYPIPVGTPSNSVIGYINLNKEGFYGLVELTGDMLEGFDSSKTGVKSYAFKNENIKGKEYVSLEVQEDAKINDFGKIASLYVGNMGIYQTDNPITFPTTIKLLNDFGNVVCSIPFALVDYIPEFKSFESMALGKYTYTIEYKGHPFTFDITLRAVNAFFGGGVDGKYQSTPISIPVGGDILKKRICIRESDAVSGQGLGLGCNSTISGFFKKEYVDLIAKQFDTTKAGVYEFKSLVETSRGGFVTLSFSVNVGMSEKSTVEVLLSPQAKASIPSGKQVGVWDVPSGAEGAGTWTFQTDLALGKEVTVWSFHNDEWLNVGVYKVGYNGVVTAVFTEDQLSPILLIQNEKKPNPESGTVIDNSASANDSVISGNSAVSTSPNTGDDNNTIVFGITTLLSLFVLGTVYLKRKKTFLKLVEYYKKGAFR